MKKIDAFFGNTFHKKVFFITLTVSVILLIVSWVMPPAWMIDSSVIAAVGELFAFGALGEVAAAIERGMNAKVTKGDVSLEVSKSEEPQSEEE